MVGLLQGCLIGLIALCVQAQKETLQVSVPTEIEIHQGETARFAIAYYPNSTNDDIQISVDKRISKLSDKSASVLNITAGNSSTPMVYLASAWRNAIEVQRHYNRFYITMKNVQETYRGDYVISISVNDEEIETVLSLHVLEKPTSVSIELQDPSFLPYDEDTPVNFTCTVNGGMNSGKVTLARKGSGDSSYLPLESYLVDTSSNDFAKIFNYTFERVLNHNDNGSDYVCEVYEGSFIIPNGQILRSAPINVAVTYEAC